MTSWTNTPKDGSSFSTRQKVIAALYGFGVYGISVYGKAHLWANNVRAVLSFLLNEDATYLLLETGGKILISGDEWTNQQKA